MTQALDGGTVAHWSQRWQHWLKVPRNLLFAGIVVAILTAHAVNFFATMVISPIGFDESFNLQAPLNLIQGNGYATENWLEGGPKLLFDAIVSTGPVVEIPVALSFLIFGVSVEAARIVMLPFFVLLLICLFILGRRVAGRWGAVAAIVVPLTLNSRADWPVTVIYGPSDALGEYAAAALLALGLVLLPRRRAWAGLALGFAALAKFITFMAAPAFLIAMLLIPAFAGANRRSRTREVVAFVGLVAAPSGAWEVVKFVSLGASGYVDSLLGYLRFVFRSGSGVDGGFRAFFLERGSRLFAAWHLPTLLIIILFGVLIMFAIIGVARYWFDAPGVSWQKGERWRSAVTAVKVLPVELLAAAGTLAIFTLWWSFISSSIFVRHTMPVLLATVPLVAVLAVRGAQWFIQSRSGAWQNTALVFVAGLGIVSSAQAAFTLEAAFRAEEWTRAQQQAAAEFVVQLKLPETQGAGWWASPEIRFLSQVPSTPLGTGTGPLVIQPILRTLDPASYQSLRDLCVEVLYDEDGFVVCTVAEDQGRTSIGGG